MTKSVLALDIRNTEKAISNLEHLRESILAIDSTLVKKIGNNNVYDELQSTKKKIEYYKALLKIINFMKDNFNDKAEIEFGHYVKFYYNGNGMFTFSLISDIANDLYNRCYSSFSGIFVQTNRLCQTLIQPFLMRYEDYRSGNLEKFTGPDEDDSIDNYDVYADWQIGLLKYHIELSKKENIKNMFDKIAEVYLDNIFKEVRTDEEA